MQKQYVIKASFRECAIEDRKKFNTSNCILPISIGQPVHEGEKFQATLSLINRSFRCCTILLDDSIQRHTLGITIEDTELNLYETSIIEGNLWYERNKKTISHLTIPYNIVRWDGWLSHNKFAHYHELIKQLFINDISYRMSLIENIYQFIERFKQRKDHFDFTKAFSRCLDYLLEECAVMCTWKEEKYDFEVYPSERNQAMTATYEKLINIEGTNLLKSVALRFKKYPRISSNLNNKINEFAEA